MNAQVKTAKAAVFKSEFRSRVVRARRGKGAYRRKAKHQERSDG